MSDSPKSWDSIVGGSQRVTKDDGKTWAVISLWGYNKDGLVTGTRTEIEADRLREHFGRTMDFAVQDLARHELL